MLNCKNFKTFRYFQTFRIFQWNNETINIWSHLIGFFYFTWRQYVINVYFLPAANANAKDHTVATVCLLGLQVTLTVPPFFFIQFIFVN